MLSIIVPSRNADKYLFHTIKNLLDSRDQRYEVVLSLNNSNNKIPDWIANLQDPRLKVFLSRTNLSMSKNWFKGLQRSKGDWICFVGSDDGIVAANLMKFIDILQLTDREEVVINHNVAFHYATRDRPASVNTPSIRPTKKLKRVKWPIKMAALFPQFFYDMPQPYSKAIVKRKILEPLLNQEKEIPGLAPDVFLGNYVAMRTKYGIFFDDLLTIRGNSILSIGAQINNNKILTASANELISDIYSKASSLSLMAFFGPTCRPAISLDHYIQSREKLKKKQITFFSLGKFWCNLTCLDKSHHKPIWNKLIILARIIYLSGFALRKIWYIKNFGLEISKDNKVLMPSRNNIFTTSRYFSERFN
jgi:glycosyltransferase involved in cell wall biosynthesis